MPSADFYLITFNIAAKGAVVFHLILIIGAGGAPMWGLIYESVTKTDEFAQLLVKQISPDKNAYFHYTAAPFTLTTLDHWASLSCASSPPE